MRTRFAVIWLIVAVFLIVGAGMVGASSGQRRVAANEDRIARLETELRERGALVVRLTGEVTELRAQLGASRLRVNAVAAERDRARSHLKATSDELLRLDEQMAAQQQNMEVLRSCLAGTLQAMQSMADGDRFVALQHMMTVDGACRAAYRLLNAQGTAN